MKAVASIKMKPFIKLSSNQQVKAKFFNMIGIEGTPNNPGRQKLSSIGNPITHGRRNRNGIEIHPRSLGIVSFQEKLKYEEDSLLLFQRRSFSQSRKKSKKKISFNDSVNVVPIPMRDEYSNRISCRIWSNATEIHENAARNSVEFAAEGWDWRTVTEDEKMYVCCITGDLIHPVHYDNDYDCHTPMRV